MFSIDNILSSFNSVDSSIQIAKEIQATDLLLQGIKTKNEDMINENFEKVIKDLKQVNINFKKYLPHSLNALICMDLCLNAKWQIAAILRKMGIELLANPEIEIDPNMSDTFEQWFKSNEGKLMIEPSLYFDCLMIQEILLTAKNNRSDLQGSLERIIEKIDGVCVLKDKESMEETPFLIFQIFQRQAASNLFKTTLQNMQEEDLKAVRSQRIQVENEIRASKNKEAICKKILVELSAKLEYYLQKENFHSKIAENSSRSSLVASSFSSDKLENLSVDSMHKALDYLSKLMQDHHSRLSTKKRKGIEIAIDNPREPKRFKLDDTTLLLTEEKRNALYYFEKAVNLQNNEGCIIKGSLMNKLDLLVKAICTDPSLAEAYFNLGFTLPKGSQISVNGLMMNQQELYIKAIELNLPIQSLAKAYCYLGDSIPKEGRISVNGQTMTSQEIYIKAIELNPSLAKAYSNLGVRISNGDKIPVNGQMMTQQAVFLKAIELDPSLAMAYSNLGAVIPKEGQLSVNGQMMNQQMLFLKALELDPSLGRAYSNLGAVIPKGGQLSVNGQMMTQQALFLRAIELDPSLSMAYSNLGTLTPEGGQLSVNGQMMTQQALFLRAIELNPSLATNYFKLGKTIPVGSQINVNGQMMTQQALFLRAKELGLS